MDLAAEAAQVFGAPPLIFKTAVSGDLEGAINYWHFMAKMEAARMRLLTDVADAAAALDLGPDTPLLGYGIRADFCARALSDGGPRRGKPSGQGASGLRRRG